MSIRNYCITVSGTTNEAMWKEIRTVIGPVPTDDQPSIDLMMADILEYDDALVEHGILVPFDKWLIWKLTVGTSLYGNLSPNKKRKDKVGHSYAPCPYDTSCSDSRSMALLEIDNIGSLPTKILHEIGTKHYFMRTAARGNKWGYECTFPGCPFHTTNNKNYFYI